MSAFQPMTYLISLVILLACLGCHAAVAAPEDLHEHRDPHGFVVRLPQGWTAETLENETILLHSEDRSLFAVIRPFFLTEPSTAEAWVRKAPQTFSDFFPQSHLLKAVQHSRLPDEVLASLTYRAHGKDSQATLLCSIAGRSGMFYAIAAPKAQFPEKKKMLAHILQTFSFSQPTAAPRATASKSGTAADASVTYIRWKDPREDAFSLEVPRGWQVTGGLYRLNALDPRPAVDVVSPEGTILLRVGDPSVPAFAEPTRFGESLGFTEGRTYSPGAGLHYIIARYRSGLDFARWYLQQRATGAYSDLQIKYARPRPDIEHLLNSYMQQSNSILMQSSCTVGEIAFTCKVDGKPRYGCCFGTTLLYASGEFRIWGGFPVGYVAPEDKVALAEAALRRMVSTWQTDPQWIARQSQTAVEVSKINARANAEISRTINDSYWQRQATLENISRNRSNATLGLTDVKDPETGEMWKVAAGHNYYWRKGDTVVGTDTDTRPDIDFAPLQQW